MASNSPPDSGLENFLEKLLQFGFVQSVLDHCLFLYNKDDVFVALLVYVDDILLIGNNSDRI